MITRAIDLSHPVTIIYPVKNPGYYCTATFGYTAPRYLAAMRTQCSHGSLPASQKPSLGVYRILLIGNTIFYAVSFSIRSAPRTNSSLTALIILTLCQLLFRWLLYEMNNRAEDTNVSVAVAWLSFSTDVAQHALTGWAMAILAIPEMDNWSSMKSLSILLSIAVYSGLQEWMANIYTTDPVLAGVAIGSVAVGAMAYCFVTGRKLRSDILKLERSTRAPLCIFIPLSVITLGALLLIVDAIILLSTADSHLFAVKNWQRRWIMVDEATNFMFVLLADFLVAMWLFPRVD